MKLFQWRREKGLTQQQVAEAIGIHQSFVSAIERSIKPKLPGPEVMRDIYILTAGAVRPNDFYDLPAWEAELIEREAQTELERRAA